MFCFQWLSKILKAPGKVLREWFFLFLCKYFDIGQVRSNYRELSELYNDDFSPDAGVPWKPLLQTLRPPPPDLRQKTHQTSLRYLQNPIIVLPRNCLWKWDPRWRQRRWGLQTRGFAWSCSPGCCRTWPWTGAKSTFGEFAWEFGRGTALVTVRDFASRLLPGLDVSHLVGLGHDLSPEPGGRGQGRWRRRRQVVEARVEGGATTMEKNFSSCGICVPRQKNCYFLVEDWRGWVESLFSCDYDALSSVTLSRAHVAWLSTHPVP